MDLHEFERIVTMLDYAMNTKRKRFVIGGMLLSLSLLFGGLAFTVLMTKTEDELYE